MIFTDRTEAGWRLARRLGHLQGRGLVVLGLSRGGVPVAFEVARALGAPLDVVAVRKLRVPFQPDLAMGAIGEDEARFVNADILRGVGVDPEQLREIEAAAHRELARQIDLYHGGRERVPLPGRIAVIVDDSVITGATARTACQIAADRGAAGLVLAIPVADMDAVAALSRVVDEVVSVQTPPEFRSVGHWYRDFPPTSDDEIADLLRRAAAVRA